MNVVSSAIGAALIGATALGGWAYASDGEPADLPALCADHAAQKVLWRLLWERDAADPAFELAIQRLYKEGKIRQSSVVDLMEHVRAVGGDNVFVVTDRWTPEDRKVIPAFAKRLDWMAQMIKVNDDAHALRVDDRVGRAFCAVTISYNFGGAPELDNAEQNRIFNAMGAVSQFKKVPTSFTVQNLPDGRLLVTLQQ